MSHYRIVAGTSAVRIRARSTIHVVVAESRAVEGFIEAEVPSGAVAPDRVPTARLDIPVVSLTSGNVLYDREMRRRVDARRFPVIRGTLISMTPSGTDGGYRVSGRITVRGVSRDYTGEMRLSWTTPETLVLDGAHAFDLRDFGLEPPRLAMLRVHPEVEVEVALVARRSG